MKTSKSGFDEMQKSKRDKIGNQSFMMMFYLLMLDMGLSGFGVKLLSYPMNVMVIILVCMIQYLIRIIIGNAYVPPETQKQRPIMRIVVMVILTVLLSAALAFSLMRSSLPFFENIEDNSAIILVVVSVVGLFIVGVVSLIKKINDKNDDD